MRRLLIILFTLTGNATQAFSGGLVSGDSILLQDLEIFVPNNWRSIRSHARQDQAFALFENEDSHAALYVKKGEVFNLRQVFVNSSEVITGEYQKRFGSHECTFIQTRKRTSNQITRYITAFKTSFLGNTYYGYCTAKTKEATENSSKTFLEKVK